MLPDIALLGIFEFYMDENWIEAWQILVHVCRNWRAVVFGSPRRLDLRLYCAATTPVGEMLDIWPLFPIVVWGDGCDIWGVNNIIAALEHNDRICQLDLKLPSWEMKKVLAAMQKPFPVLTSLNVSPRSEIAPIDPDLFMGGSAPHLQTLVLNNISFPGLPKLLLSATRLVYLDLWLIPHSGYISPETMLTCLSVLTGLERLKIGFTDPQSRPDRRSPPSLTPTFLPVLTKFWFQGVTEYLEDLVAKIDAPLLDNLTGTFFYQPLFSSPQLIQFIDRTPKLKAHDQARVFFGPNSESSSWVTLPQTSGGKLRLEIIKCRLSDQLSSLTQLCSSSIPRALISAVDRLYIAEGDSNYLCFEEDIEYSPVQWLELLRPFVAVKYLYISREYTPHIVLALQELVGERATEVLPTLQTLFLEETHPPGPVQEAVGQFVAARQLVGQRIALSCWNGISRIKDIWVGVKDVWGEMED